MVKFCDKCGEQLKNENANFCDKCGAEVKINNNQNNTNKNSNTNNNSTNNTSNNSTTTKTSTTTTKTTTPKAIKDATTANKVIPQTDGNNDWLLILIGILTINLLVFGIVLKKKRIL